MSSPRSLIGYAYLKVNFDHRKAANPVELAEPMLIRALYGWKNSPISLDSAQKTILQSWGLTIPINIIRYLLSKLQSKGYVSFDTQNKLFYTNDILNITNEILENEEDARIMYNRVVKAINTEIIRSGYDLTPHEVLEKFMHDGGLSFLSDPIKSKNLDKSDRKAHLIIARAACVSHDTSYNDQFISDISNLIIGDLLYTGITTATDGENRHYISERMNNVNVFLDTGVIFRLLGFLGERFSKPTGELISIAKKTGCNLFVFDHTLDEIIESITSVASRIFTGSDAYGPLVDYAVSNGLTTSDLMDLSQSIEAMIEEFGIYKHPSPDFNIDLSVDEKHLEWQVEVDVKQDNPIARRRDVLSLTSIFRLREGSPKKYLEDCVAIFITSNKSLSDAANRFFSRHFKEEGQNNVVQICMTDVVFTTRLWLKVPNEYEYVPKDQVIAFSISNLMPPKEVMDSFLENLDLMIKKGDISTEQAAQIKLSDLTKNMVFIEAGVEKDNVDYDTSGSIVSRLIKLEAEKKRKLVKGHVKHALTEKQKEIDDIESNYKSAIEEAKKREDAAYKELYELRKRNADLVLSERVSRRLSKIGVFFLSRFFILFLIILFTYTYVAVPVIQQFTSLNDSGYMLPIARFSFSAVMSLFTIFGLGYVSFFSKVDGLLHSWVYKQIVRVISSKDKEE